MKRPATLYLAAMLILCSCSNPGTAQTTQAAATELDLGPVELVWSQTGGTEPFVQPSGLAVDARGDLYVTDTLNHKIRVFDAEGQSLTSLGELGSGEGKFNFAWKADLSADEKDEVVASLTLDNAGNIYVADVGNSRIQKFDSGGSLLSQWPAAELENGELSQVYDLAVDSQGNIYTVDLEYFITKYDPSGRFLTRWGGYDAQDGFRGESGFMAIDSHDNLYVTHIFRSSIKKFSSTGELIAEIGLPAKEPVISGVDPSSATPFGIFVDPQGNIYTTDYLNNRVLMLDSSGKVVREWGRQGKEPGLLYGPVDIVVDSDGSIYVSETYNNRVQKFRLK